MSKSLIDCLLVVGFSLLCFANADGSDFYWGQYPGIGGAFIQGSNSDGTGLVSLPGFDRVAGIDLDLASGKMYVADLNGIKRANLDGTDVEPLVTHDQVHSIAVDAQGGKMYWASLEGGDFAVHRSNLNGSNIESIVPAQFDGFMLAIALDLPHQHLYSSESQPGPGGKGIVYRSNLDGTNLVEVVERPSFPGAYYYIETIALDINGGKVYFDHGGGTSKFFRVNFDGSDLEALYTAPSNTTIRGLSLDLCGGKMYWPEGPLEPDSGLPSLLRRANLDGTSSETVFEIAPAGSAIPLWGLVSPGYCRTFGDVYPYSVPAGDCLVGLDDILCVISGFGAIEDCPTADINPCVRNGVVDLDDILGVLSAFSANYACPELCP